MIKYIAAAEAAEQISKALRIPISDLVDIFAEIPSADVVSRNQYNSLYDENIGLRKQLEALEDDRR